jgi:amino acid transporter
LLEKEKLFLRRATGLVRTWSFLDIFAFNSWIAPASGIFTSFVLLYAFFWPGANLFLGIIIGAVAVSFQCLVYAMLVVTMPRAGGEYVWITRTLPWPIIGYVIPLVGWCIVLPIWWVLASVALSGLFFQPLAIAFGNIDAALWFMTPDGIFASFLVYVAFVIFVTIVGMKVSGKLMSTSYILGLIGTLVTIIILLLYSQSNFILAYNSFYEKYFAISGAYQAVIDEAKVTWGWPIYSLSKWSWAPTLSFLALLAYANSWSMWGAPLYGEVKGATEMKTSFWSMEGANLLNTGLLIAYLLAWIKLVGYEFFQASNLLYGTFVWYGYNPVAAGLLYEGTKVWPMLWPSPLLFIFQLTKNPFITAIVGIFCIYFFLCLWCIGYFPAVRILFAMAFDRVLPSKLAYLYGKRKIPIISSLILIFLGFMNAVLYLYVPGFATLTMMGTVVLILSFVTTSIAGMILPYRSPRVWKESPASKYKIGRIPLISIAGLITAIYFSWIIYQWMIDPTFGVAVPSSALYFFAHYAGAIILYMLMKWYRKKKEGYDLSMVYKEIPVE